MNTVSTKIVDHKDKRELENIEQYIKIKKIEIPEFENFIKKEKTDSNIINECLIEEKDGAISNICFFNGTKDTGLIELEVANQRKAFLKKATEVAFTTFSAKTVTIFSDKESKEIESIGFESLGDYDGKTTYIMEDEKEAMIGRRK